MTFVQLPRKHAEDWFARCGESGAWYANVIGTTPRTITLDLDANALDDLVSDAKYYASEMGPTSTDDIDYRPSARRCLASLERQGLVP